MVSLRVWKGEARCAAALVALFAGMFSAGHASAGGLYAYEFGTAEVGLASAGYGARAQDASTVFTNPAGMTRLGGNQFLASGQLDYGRTEFGIGLGTSPALGGDTGGNAFGSNGWFLGGGGFYSHSISPELKVGFALTGNFGGVVQYDDNWVGRYYVRQTKMVGFSAVPAIAYKVNEKLSLGASISAMYGYYYNTVAINNVNPAFGDGQLKLSDTTWGWGGNLGLLYEIDPRTRLSLTWNSQVNLDFNAPAEFSNLAPGLSTLLNNSGLLYSNIKVGIKVPQQVMGSVFAQLNDKWAVLGSIGWQQWSKFGQVQLGIDNSANPSGITTNIPFKNTWHVAAGAQYRMSEPLLLNFGIAYDSGFQSGTVSPLLPTNAAWRFGVGAEHQATKTFKWGLAAEYLYGGNLDVALLSSTPVAVGGRGNLVGSYGNVGLLFMGAYANWTF
jgi:long-chain fatty acid transport protein